MPHARSGLYMSPCAHTLDPVGSIKFTTSCWDMFASHLHLGCILSHPTVHLPFLLSDSLSCLPQGFRNSCGCCVCLFPLLPLEYSMEPLLPCTMDPQSTRDAYRLMGCEGDGVPVFVHPFLCAAQSPHPGEENRCRTWEAMNGVLVRRVLHLFVHFPVCEPVCRAT